MDKSFTLNMPYWFNEAENFFFANNFTFGYIFRILSNSNPWISTTFGVIQQ
jgi:hypothetical protein